MKLDGLLKKKFELEAQIAAARELAKRRARVADAIERLGAFAMTDDEIIAAVKVALDRNRGGGHASKP